MVGHAVSILSFGSFFFRWLYRPFFTKTPRQIIEGIAVFGAVAALSFLTYWTPYGSLDGVSLLYFLVIPLIWAALRSGSRGTTLSLFIIAVIASSGVLYGWGPLSQNVSDQTLFLQQVLIGTISIMFLIFTSIMEERKESERVLGEHVGRLEEVLEKIRSEDQAKTEFLAVLAHELRNPLSPILSSLELMKQYDVSEAYKKHVNSIVIHVHTMARLLDDLLDISRISQKKFKLQKEPVELRSVLKQSLESTEGYLSGRKHAVTMSLPNEPLWMLADPVRLEQIFVNLLHNAGKYTEPGGKIWISVAQKKDAVEVSVKDTGIGIAKEKLPYIFEPLRKGDDSSRRPGGLGIGLSLAKRLAELHDGAVEARSGGLGKGSEFIVTVPSRTPVQLILPPRKGARRARFYERKKVPTSYRVLVVDDNEAAAEGMAELLRAGGHKTAVCYDGPEALESAQKFEPHAIVLDIGLPTMDGYEVARALRARGSRASIIALTGYGQEDDKQKSRAAGFDHHLVKPVSIVDVEAILADL